MGLLNKLARLLTLTHMIAPYHCSKYLPQFTREIFAAVIRGLQIYKYAIVMESPHPSSRLLQLACWLNLGYHLFCIS